MKTLQQLAPRETMTKINDTVFKHLVNQVAATNAKVETINAPAIVDDDITNENLKIFQIAYHIALKEADFFAALDYGDQIAIMTRYMSDFLVDFQVDLISNTRNVSLFDEHLIVCPTTDLGLKAGFDFRRIAQLNYMRNPYAITCNYQFNADAGVYAIQILADGETVAFVQNEKLFVTTHDKDIQALLNRAFANVNA